MRRVISVFLPHWATDRWWQLEAAGALPQTPPGEEPAPSPPHDSRHPRAPTASRRPLVLSIRAAARRLIHAADPTAQALGLYPGMPIAQAQAMLPGLRIADATPDEDTAALSRLAAWCLRFTPLAAPSPPDGVWLDITGCAHLHGGETALLEKLLDRLSEAGFTARAAVADTPGAAHAMARHGLDALCVIPPGATATAAAIAPLPLTALRLPPDTLAGLHLLGLDTIGALQNTPRAPLARRFGATLLRRLDQAHGRAPEPLEPVLPPDLCRVRQTFPEPIATAEDLRRVTALLAERLAEKLRTRDEGARRLDLTFQRVDGTAELRLVGTAAATRDAAHITRLLAAQIEGIDPGFGVDAVMLSAPRTERLGARQVISDLATAPAMDLSALIDTLLNRLGETRLFRAAPVESDVPERSLRRLPPGDTVPQAASWPATLPRPPRLLHPPRPVEAVALLPDQPPVRFTWRGIAHRVRCADGPERIFGEWWRGDDEVFAVRDYFQVEDDCGQRFWLFRQGDGIDPATGDLSWYLHGVFG